MPGLYKIIFVILYIYLFCISIAQTIYTTLYILYLYITPALEKLTTLKAMHTHTQTRTNLGRSQLVYQNIFEMQGGSQSFQRNPKAMYAIQKNTCPIQKESCHVWKVKHCLQKILVMLGLKKEINIFAFIKFSQDDPGNILAPKQHQDSCKVVI